MENIRSLLQFSPNAYNDLYARCNAGMLADDKSIRSVFFDSIQGKQDPHEPLEDFEPCFKAIKLPDTIRDTSYGNFLSSIHDISRHRDSQPNCAQNERQST